MFRPIDALLLNALPSEPLSSRTPLQVMDIGCGTGGTTLALAQAVAGRVECIGIDMSAPMLAFARDRAERSGARAQFVCGDAQTHAFEPARFDLLASRFGVMFFGDFEAAFANLWRAAKRDARLCLVVWRSPDENPFMTAAERAAAPLLPQLPARRAGEPGQFGLADAGRMRLILEHSGWRDIDIQAADVDCALNEQDLLRYFSRLGPVAQALPQLTACRRDAVLDAVIKAFEPFREGSEVQFTAACWRVIARA
jgi:SAM-dependent methyltransferase